MEEKEGTRAPVFPVQILSNEEKRLNFDRYGDVGENQGFPHQQHQQSHRHSHPFHESFYFDESFFHFPFNSEHHHDSTDEKYLLHFSHYVNEVVPESFRRPFLIKITSDWCFSCVHIEPVWKEVVQELEALGEPRRGVGWGEGEGGSVGGGGEGGRKQWPRVSQRPGVDLKLLAPKGRGQALLFWDGDPLGVWATVVSGHLRSSCLELEASAPPGHSPSTLWARQLPF